jgi:hypothetical protein
MRNKRNLNGCQSGQAILVQTAAGSLGGGHRGGSIHDYQRTGSQRRSGNVTVKKR